METEIPVIKQNHLTLLFCACLFFLSHAPCLQTVFCLHCLLHNQQADQMRHQSTGLEAIPWDLHTPEATYLFPPIQIQMNPPVLTTSDLASLAFFNYASELIFPTGEGRDICNRILCQLVYLKFLLTSFLQFLSITTLRCCSPCMGTSPEILWINSCAVHHIILMTIYQLDKIYYTSSEQTKL